MVGMVARERHVLLVAVAMAVSGSFPGRGFAQPEGETPKQQAPSEMLTAEQVRQLREVLRLTLQVDKLSKANRQREALPLAIRALRVCGQAVGKEHRYYASSLNNLAELYEAIGEYAKAEPLYVQACDIRKKVLGEETSRYATSLHNLAMLYKSMGKYAKAEPLLVRACEIRKKVLGEEHPAYAKSLSNLAVLYEALDEHAKAEPLLVQACDILKKALGEGHPDYAASLNNLAMYYKSMGEYAKAEPLYVRALDITKRALGEQHPSCATSLNNLAVLYEAMGEYTKAESLYLQALDIKRKVLGERHPAYATSLHNLAGLYETMGEYAKAEPLIVRALGITKRAVGEEHPDYANSLGRLAEIYEAVGEYAKAEPLYVRARDITRRVLGEENQSYATSLDRLAGLYDEMGEYAKAEPLYLQARDIRKRVLGEDHPAYAKSLHHLASLYDAIGEHAKAEPLFIQARDILKRALGEGHPDYATSLNNLALHYKSIGECAKAEPLYVQALDITKRVLGEEHPTCATRLSNLAMLYRRMGDYGKAEPLFVQAVAIRKKTLGEEHPAYARSLDNLASLYEEMGEYAKAEPLAQAAMDVEVAFANRVIAFLPEARAMTLRETLTGPETLLSILRKMPERSDRAAYAAVWRTHGLVSRSLAARRQLRGQSPEAKALWARLRTTTQQLAQLTLAVPRPDQREARQRRLAEFNGQKERLEAELARASAEFRRGQAIAVIKPENLVRLLRQDEAIVELLRVPVWNSLPGGRGKPVGEWHYDAFVLRRSRAAQGVDVAWVPLGTARSTGTAVLRWRLAIAGEPATGAESRRAADDLRKSVWDKIEPHLAGCSRVTIIPDGSLCFMPWAALPGRKPGTCLLEDYAIATAPGAHQLYAMLTEAQSDQGKLLLVGGVSYDAAPSTGLGAGVLLASDGGTSGRARGPAVKGRLHWGPLPQTEQEVDAIAKDWSGKPSSVVLRGTEAGEQALRERLPGSRFVHLATHGFFANSEFRSRSGHDPEGERLFHDPELLATRRARVTARNPLILSGVVLAGANLPPKTDKLGLPTGDDGILTAEEIVSLDLRGTELAVLSACDTGLGGVAGGEGVMGLTRAFHLAGARNVVSSLWKVDDQATAALMKLFYYKLWQQKKPPIEALREAQLAIYRNPEQIGKLAGLRGPDFTKTARLVDGGQRSEVSKRAPTRLWAAFVLSGPGN